MLISGSIGITILKNNNKTIILLADDHSSKNYCNHIGIEGKEHLTIKNFLKKELQKGNQILLEEIVRENNFNLEELWPDSPHTQDLKDYFLSEDEIVGIDIRPYLLPFSHEMVEVDENLGKISIRQYLSSLDNFFRLKGKLYDDYFYPVLKNIKIRNKGIETTLEFLKKEYLKIAEDTKFDHNLNFYFNNKKQVLSNISLFCDQIMESYTLISCFTTEKNSIIHTGLFHSSSILDLLIKIYNFTVVHKNGINSLDKLDEKQYPSCVYLPGLEKFGFKD